MVVLGKLAGLFMVLSVIGVGDAPIACQHQIVVIVVEGGHRLAFFVQRQVSDSNLAAVNPLG